MRRDDFPRSPEILIRCGRAGQMKIVKMLTLILLSGCSSSGSPSAAQGGGGSAAGGGSTSIGGSLASGGSPSTGGSSPIAGSGGGSAIGSWNAGNPDGACSTGVPAEGRAVDTSMPTAVVGMGTLESCTFAALAGAVAAGGIVTFNCG